MTLSRGNGPRRRTPLKRGDKPLARGAGLACGAGLARGTPMPRTPPPDRTSPPPKPKRRTGHGIGDDIPAAVRRTVHDRDGGCARCADTRPPLEVHHRVPRGAGGRLNAHRLSALILLCPDHHRRWAEQHRNDARADGYICPMAADPTTVPVRWWDGELYLLDDNGGRHLYRKDDVG